ncbi:hypothetical protein K461DRAFT_266893 [Myriangium duriaei CBS 260.36]|uniref:F-box domain-containing protein n=1 Tax=Myriangium duriaei CBS 260.36 TaxID=1168546 RepID=A0A9P4J5W5_9PEZI|nr:hypothetical protein K461DRAFT_266893 [Myriangium duriaei CBS 260.36]
MTAPTRPRNTNATLEALPAELKLDILQKSKLENLLNLIKASPAMLRVHVLYRRPILHSDRATGFVEDPSCAGGVPLFSRLVTRFRIDEGALRTTVVALLNKQWHKFLDEVVGNFGLGQDWPWVITLLPQNRWPNRAPLPFAGDDDDQGPPFAYTVLWRGTHCPEFGKCIPNTLRDWGYVMWDAQRIRMRGGVELVKKQWNSRSLDAHHSAGGWF